SRQRKSQYLLGRIQAPKNSDHSMKNSTREDWEWFANNARREVTPIEQLGELPHPDHSRNERFGLLTNNDIQSESTESITVAKDFLQCSNLVFGSILAKNQKQIQITGWKSCPFRVTAMKIIGKDLIG